MPKATILRSVMAALVLVTATVGCAPIQGRQTTGEYVDDVTISTKVRTAIVSELGLEQIGVETMQSVVQLSGFVDSPQIRSRAGEIAAGVTGVRDVENDLVVR